MTVDHQKPAAAAALHNRRPVHEKQPFVHQQAKCVITGSYWELTYLQPTRWHQNKLNCKQIYANAYMLLARYLWHEAPLQSRRKASTATATQSRLLHFCNDPVCTFGNQVLGTMPVTTRHGPLHKAQFSKEAHECDTLAGELLTNGCPEKDVKCFHANTQALTLMKGSCLPYRLVNIRS